MYTSGLFTCPFGLSVVVLLSHAAQDSPSANDHFPFLPILRCCGDGGCAAGGGPSKWPPISATHWREGGAGREK